MLGAAAMTKGRDGTDGYALSAGHALEVLNMGATCFACWWAPSSRAAR
jgi:hypothetical protein